MTMTMETISEHRCFGGVQGYYRHAAASTNCPMRFSAYVPPHEPGARLPVLYYLSGLTCTEENFTVKAAVQRHAAERGIVIVAPDTSPRGEGVPDADRYDLGQGAGFYLNATVEPWSRHYRMYDYVVEELPALVAERFPIDPDRQGVFGHSMGGHGALTIGLRHPDRFRSVSALAPICGPSRVEFGKAILAAYLGDDPEAWAAHDAVSLIEAGRRTSEILIDQGDADEFYLGGNMMTETFEAACGKAGQPVEVRFQPGYDHSYFFVQTFIADHIAHHARIVG
jgi:S-formylglutathione hydrolase